MYIAYSLTRNDINVIDSKTKYYADNAHKDKYWIYGILVLKSIKFKEKKTKLLK